MDRLRIGIIAPPWFAVPPTGYGGTERVVSYLADGLSACGHDVTLFASGGSHTCAQLHATFPRPPSELLGDSLVEAQHVAMAYAHWREFDLIHDHTVLGLVAGSTLPIPVVHTIHGAVTPQAAGFYAATAGRLHLVCISGHQRSTLPPGLTANVIHNALNPAAFPFSATKGDYLLFVGRMNPEKGILDALEIARRTRRPLLVLAKVNEPGERRYFAEYVRPALSGVDVEIREQPSEEERLRAFRDALVTLFPISWDEPFGLVMIESMATGTPVIAFRRGSVPEIIEDGRTGFICDTIDQAVDAVDRAATLDRKECRLSVERRFNAGLAVVRHEELYRRLLQSAGVQSGQTYDIILDGAPPTSREGREAIANPSLVTRESNVFRPPLPRVGEAESLPGA